MKCRACGYRLFGIKERRCPECGAGFKPSEFAFRPMTVMFGCPHCEALHPGNGPDGLPMPQEVTCACGEIVTVDAMVATPAQGVADDETGVVENPWLKWWNETGRARRLGDPVRAWWATVKMTVLTPGRLMRATPLDATTLSAVRFATVNFVVANGAVGALIAILILLGFGVSAEGWFPELLAGLIVLALFVCISAVCSLAGLMLYAVLAHVAVEGLQREQGSQSRTVQCFAYSTGTMAVMVWPCLLFPPFVVVFAIWWMLCTIIALQEAQKVTAGEATMAVLAPGGVAVTGLFLLAILENWL